MNRTTYLAVLVICASVLPARADAQSRIRPLGVDQILDLNSTVGGEIPSWSRDGSHILYSSNLGGGLMQVAPTGGYPQRVPVTLGGPSHFTGTQEVRYSPDGNWISWVSIKGGAPEVWIWSTRDAREIQLTRLRGEGIMGYSWSPDSRTIAFASNRYGQYDIWTVSVPTGEAVKLTSDKEYEVYPSWTPDGHNILYVKLDARWMDHDVIAMNSDGSNPHLVLRDTNFFDYRAGSAFGYPDVSPDGSTLMFRSYRSGWLNYWLVPLAGGQPRQVAAENADQSGAEWSPDGKSILYTSNANGSHSLRVATAAGGAVRTLVSPQPGIVAQPAWSPDGTRISYTLATPKTVADLYVIPSSGGEAKQITFSMPAGNVAATIVVPEKIVYHSADGFDINAYLYKPLNLQPGQKAPAIVWSHGGPAGQYGDNMTAEIQFFVQRGYVALAPNFRGSSGYGRKFQDANAKCWGHCDLQDIVAGVDYLKKLPYVDASKMGITGNSYGGYMACAAAAWAPGVFQAAIGRSGYCNRYTFVNEGEYQHIQQLAYSIGPFETNKELYKQISPFYSIKDIQTPLFLIHGYGKFPESKQYKEFADEMERLYKTFRYKAYPNENYYIYRRDNLRQMYLDMLDFFNEYLPVNEPARAQEVTLVPEQ